jgi:hypothetical protein
LHIATRTLRTALKGIWNLLILRDNWQGESCVAFFGALGWAVISSFSTKPNFGLQQFSALGRIMHAGGWEFLLIAGGLVQILGLRYQSSWARAIGATIVSLVFTCAFMAIAIDGPLSPGMSLYLACISIEVCAIIYQVAQIVRKQEYPKWRVWTGK